MKGFLHPKLSAYLFFFLMSLFISCDNDDADLVPSYITVDRFNLTTDYGQGTASHKITDVWVYLDETLIGAYELPARVPVLSEGEQNITLRPGIKINGISGTRAIYPYLNSVTRKAILVKDSLVDLNAVNTGYRSNVAFPWMETFEMSGMTLDTTAKSTVALQRTSDPARIFTFPGESGSQSGWIQILSDTSVFEAVTKEMFDFPSSGSEVFMEMNYKTNNTLTVGVFYKSSGMEIQRPLLVLNKSDVWNKIYINLSVPKNDSPNATDFRIFFGAKLDKENSQADIYIDNCKLVHFKTEK